MWPKPGQGLDRVLAGEAAVEGLYREALTRWSPVAMAAVLPTFGAAVTADAGYPQDPQLPPDPAAVEQGNGWVTVAEVVIVAGVAALFAAAVVEAMDGLGIPLPGLPSLKRQERAGNPQVAPPTSSVTVTRDQAKQSHREDPNGPSAARPDPTTPPHGPNPQDDTTKPLVAPDLDPAVLAIVNTAAADMDAEQLHEAMRIVDETPALAQARDQVVQVQRDAAARTPKVVAEKVTAAIRDTAPDEAGTVTMAAQRSAAADVLQPDSDAMAQIAATAGHLSAAVQNHALQAAAELSEDAPELEKFWACTLDGRTRDTHWAADGARVPLAAPFIVGGEPLMFPADPAGSPAETYGCRCRMGILARDESLPTEVDRHTERLDGHDSVAVHRGGRTQVEEIEARAARGNTRARDNRDGVGTVASAAPDDQELTMTSAIAAEDLPDGLTIRPSAELAATAEPAIPVDGATGETVDGETFLTFTDALFAVTGIPTDDRRMLLSTIELEFRDFPLPLQWKEKTGDGHTGSVTVGVIESGSLNDQGEIRGSGYMLNNSNAYKALELIQHGVNRPSIDMADATAVLAYDDGTEVTEENLDPTQRISEAYTRGTVTACTIVAIPAFGQTRLALNPERESRDVAMTAAALTAAAAYQQPVYEPAMFAAADPNLLAPMRLSIDPDTGHVFGFIATWKDKHRSVGLGHIKPPRSHTNYEHFHTSPGVHLSNGTVLPVGRLTVGIGHAPTRGISSAAAQAHYDNVEACWAIGRISEHRLGIYFSGVVAPWASPEKVQMGLASPVSGDWRPVGQGNALELVAVLSVNTPGFLCKTETDASGAPLAMVASLTVADDVPVMSYSLDELKAVFAQVLAEDRAASNADRAQLVNNGVLMAPSEASLPGPQASADPAPAADDTATDTDLAPAAVDATDRMGELIAQFSGIDAPATPATPAEAAPVELTPTERMGSLISEFNGKVRDAAYWGKPVGTPITPGMKPKGRSDHDLSKASHNQLVQGLHDAEVHGDREGAAEIRAEAEKRPASKGQVSKLDADGKLQYDYGTGANAKSNERRDRILMARSAPERLSTKDLKTARTHMLADQKRMADPRFKLPGEDTSAQDKKRAQELAGVERELEARKKAPSSKSSGGSSPKA